MEEGSCGKGKFSYSFFLKVVVLLLERMSTGRLFDARGADTPNFITVVLLYSEKIISDGDNVFTACSVYSNT